MSKAILALSVLLAVGNPFTIETDLSTALTLADPQECIAEKCPNEWAACQKDSKCIPVLQACEDKCGTKETCWKTCLATKGDSAAVNVAKCAAANNCLGQEPETSTALMLADPEECIKEKCPKEDAECEKDPKCRPALADCQKKCGTKQTCWEFCLPGKGSQAAIDVAKCAAKNHCISQEPFLHPFEKCMSKSCTMVFTECVDDEMCRYFLRQCRIPEGMWNFEFDCLVEKSAFSPKLRNFFDCSGHNKCI